MSGTSRCHMCPDEPPYVTPGDVINHLRVVHPEVFNSIERWPDGAIVWHEINPTPEDITGDAA